MFSDYGKNYAITILMYNFFKLQEFFFSIWELRMITNKFRQLFGKSGKLVYVVVFT